MTCREHDPHQDGIAEPSEEGEPGEELAVGGDAAAAFQGAVGDVETLASTWVAGAEAEEDAGAERGEEEGATVTGEPALEGAVAAGGVAGGAGVESEGGADAVLPGEAAKDADNVEEEGEDAGPTSSISGMQADEIMGGHAAQSAPGQEQEELERGDTAEASNEDVERVVEEEGRGGGEAGKEEPEEPGGVDELAADAMGASSAAVQGCVCVRARVLLQYRAARQELVLLVVSARHLLTTDLWCDLVSRYRPSARRDRKQKSCCSSTAREQGCRRPGG